MQQQPPTPHTIGAALLGVKDAQGQPLSKEQLKAHINIFTIAGIALASLAARWALAWGRALQHTRIIAPPLQCRVQRPARRPQCAAAYQRH